MIDKKSDGGVSLPGLPLDIVDIVPGRQISASAPGAEVFVTCCGKSVGTAATPATVVPIIIIPGQTMGLYHLS